MSKSISTNNPAKELANDNLTEASPAAPNVGVPADASANDDPFRLLSGQPVVYMLRCRDGSLYTGWTNDFAQRLAAHRSGKGGKYTRSRLPLQPAYLEPVADRSAALQREAAIKKLPPAKKRELVESDLNMLRNHL